MEDFCDREGCNKLCEIIRQFWRKLGKFPKVWCEDGTTDQKKKFYTVRSNMRNGLPQ